MLSGFVHVIIITNVVVVIRAIIIAIAVILPACAFAEHKFLLVSC